MKYILSSLAWTLGILTMLLLLPLANVILRITPDKKISPVAGLFLRIIIAGFLVRVKCEGREKIDRSRAHLFMANHASFFDLFILGGYLVGNMRGIEAAEHFSWPLWGTFLKRTQMIPIDRTNARASMTSINRAVALLEEGYSILILPEGTRTRDGEMLPFKKLPFKLAKKAGVSLVPVGLKGTFEIKRKTSWLLHPSRVVVRFGEPIPAETVGETDLESLKEMTRQRIAALIRD